MKKSIVYSVTAALFCVTAVLYAAGTKENFDLSETEKEGGWRFLSHLGFKFKRPDFFDSDGKNIDVKVEGEEDKKNDEVLYCRYSYRFFPDELEEEYTAFLQNERMSEEEKRTKIDETLARKLKPVFAIVVLRTPLLGNADLKAVTGYPNNKVIRKTPDFTQVLAFANFNAEGLSEKSSILYKTMLAQARGIIHTVKCTDPVSSEAQMMKVKKLVFETVDLEGNKITNDIFKEYDVTMVNIWATWCPPCKKDLSELAQVYNDFKDKKCNVLGLVGDVSLEDAGSFERAKQLARESKCGYIMLQNSIHFEHLLQNVSSWPTTVFVDKNGSVIASTVNDIIVGSRDASQFTKAMQRALDTVKK